MADGYARAAKKMGVLITSTGPGAANAVGGLVEANFASTPLLHITGQTATRFIDKGMGGAHDTPDQLGIMGSAGKAAFRIHSAETAFAVLKHAVEQALTGLRGPVTVEVPIDIQRAEIERPGGLDWYELPSQSRNGLSESQLSRLAQILGAAKRPMLWLGRGADESTAAVEKLLELGFGMVTSWAARGVVSMRHNQNLGCLNGTGLAEVEGFFETVELMLVVGARLRGHETIDFSTALPKRLVQIDIDERADGRTYNNVGFFKGDATTVLEQLTGCLPGNIAIESGFAEEVAQLKKSVTSSYKASLGPYADFADQLADVLPKDAVWARDITINNSTWGNRLVPLHDNSSNLYPIGAGIGQGMCLGIGAALASEKRKTVIMIGDGGFFLSIAEFWTAIQENLDITVILMNDQGYGVIRHIQDKVADGRRRFDKVLGPDIRLLAEISDVPYWRVSKGTEFGKAAGEAIATKGLTIVEVDMCTIGHHPPYFPYSAKV